MGSKLRNIGDSLKGVSDSINSLRSLRDDMNWDNAIGGYLGVQISLTLNNVKNTLTNAARTLATFNSIPNVPQVLQQK